MSHLLYIEASPRKARSASIDVAKSFVSTFLEHDDNNRVETVDLWNTTLPQFDGDTINAKYRVMHGENPTAEETAAWGVITQITDQFKSADHYLFSSPMWNFSIPYKLKHYIDVISQPGLTWSFSPETGYEGLVTGKSATLVLARGGEYSSDSVVAAMDFQRTYLEMILGFIGFKDINTVLIEPTLTDTETKAAAIALAKDQVNALAKKL